MPNRTGRRIVLAVVALAGLAVAWWLGSPLFLNRTVQEEFPTTVAAVVPDTMTRAQVERVMSEMADIRQPVDEAMPPTTGAPVALTAGRFRDADRLHRGSGEATIYRLPSGAHLLRLENFNVTNGPDLRVLLSAHSDPMTRAELHASNPTELGELKGNIGNQNYEIPAEVDVSAQASVIIYCKPFQVIFSVAPLRPLG